MIDILSLIFPRSCLGCGKGKTYICAACLSKTQVLNTFNPLEKTFSIFKYEGIIREAIVKIKYNFVFDIASELSQICVQKLRTSNLAIQDPVVLPIPLHQSRKKWRGFNQSEIIGRLIAEKLGWQFETDVLTRPRQGKNQVGLNKIKRVRNIRGKFALNPEAKLYQNKTYIIFDDVITTGSTMTEAIKTLKKSNIKKVLGLTIAR